MYLCKHTLGVFSENKSTTERFLGTSIQADGGWEPEETAWTAVTKYHGLSGLKTTKSSFSQSRRLEAQDQGTSVDELWWEPYPGWKLSPSHCFFTGQREREEASSLMTLIRALIPFKRAPPSWPHLILITSQRPQHHHTVGRVSNYKFGGVHKHSVHNSNYKLYYFIINSNFKQVKKWTLGKAR